jgi:uncharacterized protein (TIGR03435 family)
MRGKIDGSRRCDAMNRVTAWVVLLGWFVALAQTPATPKFEVASVKAASPDSKFMVIHPTPGGRLNITNLTVKDMIGSAWSVQPFQISGGPAWMDSVRYDVSAKAEGAAKIPELMQMLRSLLADRFQLVIHRETKELPIFGLVLARKDGELGPQLVESKDRDCTLPDATKPPPPPLDSANGLALGCGQLSVGVRQLRGAAISIQQLPSTLSPLLGRTVIDQTGLKGTYDVTLRWTPDGAQLAGPQPGAPTPTVTDSGGPSIFAALQEQLGLKLESTKGPVEILMIDHVHRPDEN